MSNDATTITDASERRAHEYAQERATNEGRPMAVYASQDRDTGESVWWVRPLSAVAPPAAKRVAIYEPNAGGPAAA